MRARLIGSFDAYTEGQGCISKDDLVQVLVELGQNSETAKQIADVAHLSSNGQVDCKEFVNWSMGPLPPLPVLPPIPVYVAMAQQSYRDGLLNIATALRAADTGLGQDVGAAATELVENHYAFISGPVMFKPTNGHERCRFASTPGDSSAYFCNPLLQYAADVQLQNEGTVMKGDQMFAQGQIVFSFINDLTKVIDFTFGYVLDDNRAGRIFLHHSCDAPRDDNIDENPAGAEPEQESTQEIAAAQELWSSGLMEIAAVAGSGGDCLAKAGEFVDRLYAFKNGPVLFKTFTPATNMVNFANNRDQVMKYFGNPVVVALTGIRFENMCSITRGEHIFVRGNYHFTTAMGTEADGEYVFGYERNPTGGLSIFLQHSSTPFL